MAMQVDERIRACVVRVLVPLSSHPLCRSQLLRTPSAREALLSLCTSKDRTIRTALLTVLDSLFNDDDELEQTAVVPESEHFTGASFIAVLKPEELHILVEVLAVEFQRKDAEQIPQLLRITAQLASASSAVQKTALLP